MADLKKTPARYLPAARAALDSVACEEPARLDSVDRRGMVRELGAAGVRVEGRSDAYIARRYADAFAEEDHPRDEHGRFGESGGGAKVASEHLGIQSLTPKGRDSSDFHEVSAMGVSRALNAAHIAGGGGPIPASTAEKISAKRLGIESLRGTDNSSFHQVHVSSVKKALTEAHAAGASAAAKGAPAPNSAKEGAHGIAIAKTPSAAARAKAEDLAQAKRNAARAGGSDRDQIAAARGEKAGAPAAPRMPSQAEVRNAHEAAVHEARLAATGTTAPGQAGAADRAKMHAATAATALAELKRSSDPTQSYRSGAATTAAKQASASATRSGSAAGHAAAAEAQRSAAQAQHLAGNSKLAAAHEKQAASHDRQALARAVQPGDHPSTPARVARYPVGSKVTTAAAGQMFPGGHGIAQTSGTVVGHNRQTGNVHVQFGDGTTRPVDPRSEGLSRVHSEKPLPKESSLSPGMQQALAKVTEGRAARAAARRAEKSAAAKSPAPAAPAEPHIVGFNNRMTGAQGHMKGSDGNIRVFASKAEAEAKASEHRTMMTHYWAEPHDR